MTGRPASPPATVRRLRAQVSGRVQGVGFRPFVFSLAHDLGLAGFVLNDAAGVLVEVEGAAVEEFLARLRTDAPPLATIETLEPLPELAAGGSPPAAPG